MSMTISQSVDEIIEASIAAGETLRKALRDAFSPIVLSLASFWESLERTIPTRAELQSEKRARRQARHYAITHGKHGRKRPK